MKTKAFAIFEGGGAKGIAHAGALKAAEERLEFIGVAGTSAGSIIASLVAAGYTADEIYRPENPTALLQTNLTQLLDNKEWAAVKQLRDRSSTEVSKNKRLSWPNWLLYISIPLVVVYSVWTGLIYFLFVAVFLVALVGVHFFFPNLSYLVASWLKFHFAGLWHMQLLLRVAKNKGALRTDKFRDWLNTALAQKLSQCNPPISPSGVNGRVCFKDLPRPLKIIAANVANGRIRVFEQSSTDAVADAVCASISIPLVFVPKVIGVDTYVDGGILSNFPAWVFDLERQSAPNLTPTIGFRLSSTRREQNNSLSDFGGYLTEVARCALFGENGLETRNVEPLHELLLSVDLDLLAFDATDQQKKAAYNEAYRQAVGGLRWVINRVPDERMQSVLWSVAQIVSRVTGHNGHLRVGVMLPRNQNCLEMVYTYNMDTDRDCDDRLVLQKGQGASGHCWATLESVVCNLVDAQETYATRWNMNKYQQRLIRETLKTLMCIPLFRSEGDAEDGFLGVLCIDSDDDLGERFQSFVRENGTAIADPVENVLGG